MFFKGILMCGGVRVRCGCGRKIMMWGEVRCGEIFSKNCEVRWGAETLFFEKCSSLLLTYLLTLKIEIFLQTAILKTPHYYSVKN